MVEGGWNMKGKEGQEWPSTMAVLDLTVAAPAWQTVPQPCRRRALIAASFHDRLFAMGGMDGNDSVSADVDIFDPGSGAWSKGPKLPGAGVNPFAPAACVLSLADGRICRLNEAAQRWDEAGRGMARLAHWTVGAGKTLLAPGGASRGGNLDLVESIEARP